MCPLPSQPGVGQLGNNNNNNNECKCWKGMDSPESHGSAKPAEPPLGSVCRGAQPSPGPLTPAPSIGPRHVFVRLHANKPSVSLCSSPSSLFCSQKITRILKKNLKKFTPNVKKTFKIHSRLVCSAAVRDLKQPAGWHERTGMNTTVLVLPIWMISAILKLWLRESAYSLQASDFSFLN